MSIAIATPEMVECTPQHREDADGEGDVGGRGDTPAIGRHAPVVEEEVNQRRSRHATGGAQHRKNRLAERRELPRDDFALDFEADREEEDDHQAVVNQLLDGHAARIDPVDDPVGAVDRQREVGLQQMVVVLRREGEVGQQHGNSDADEQHHAARPGRLHETTAPQP